MDSADWRSFCWILCACLEDQKPFCCEINIVVDASVVLGLRRFDWDTVATGAFSLSDLCFTLVHLAVGDVSSMHMAGATSRVHSSKHTYMCHGYRGTSGESYNIR